ncbi:NAD-dependent epimerase/dehydratase family protein [Candidatus Pacearchaeota archaeon]|nr:NAD-dependent epimerase/dehydratase family protein [Candidatus Pacearchaeota archaeon]
MTKRKKILVTGGAGFIGSHVADLLIEHGNNVVIIDNLSTGKEENINKKARFYHEDLLNFSKINEIFEKEKPEIIYHLAAQIDVRKSVENPIEDAKQNILSSINLLEMAVKHQVKHFIFSSTGGAIYGDTKNIPTPEEHTENPISPYGISKLAIEKYINYYNNLHGLKYTILRYGNVYGERQNPKSEAGVIAIFFDNLLNGKNPVIFGGLQTRDFIHVEDVAWANLLVLKDVHSETYNIGTGKETDIIEIFSRINDLFYNKFKPEFKEKKKGEQEKSCLSYNKIKSLLNWYPRISLDEGLSRTYKWMAENK